MPIITKLSVQKNKNRVNIFLDGKFSFGLSLNEVVKSGLAVGQSFSQKQLELFLFKSILEKFYHKTINFLSFRPRSKKEIVDYLKKNYYKLPAITPKLAEKLNKNILEKLKKQNLIGDLEFAKWWVEQRLTFNPRGLNLLRAELYKKGVKREIVEEVLKSIDRDKQIVLAQKIINKKIKLYKNLKNIKLKQKMYSFLARRGFDYEVIKTVIDEKGIK
ncbi:RecX family transcriptional regulator [Patescibacteria group bacterium]